MQVQEVYPFMGVGVFCCITWQIKSPIKVNNAEVIAFVQTGYLARRLKYLSQKKNVGVDIKAETETNEERMGIWTFIASFSHVLKTNS